MGSRRKAREIALQILYSSEFSNNVKLNVPDVFPEDEPADEDSTSFAKLLVSGTLEKKEEIDQMTGKLVKNWDIERLSLIDRNIIRICAYEMIFLSHSNTHEDVIPHAVSINEAVEIAKKFSTPDSGKFVNGVLDQLRKEYTQEKG
jgi:N utilization substance protein B